MRTERGMTLLELMVATVVISVVMAGVVGAVIAQQKAYYGTMKSREAEGNSQTALLHMERHLKMAGFGMDPSMAFDFMFYLQVPGTDPATTDDPNGLCPATMAPCRRDRIDNSDELVFHYRDPNYWVPDNPTAEPRGSAWRLIDLTDGTARIRLRGNERLVRGQVLQAVCQNGINWTYFTVALGTPPGANNPLGTDVQLVPFNNNHPFLRQNVANPAGGWHQAACFRDGMARVYKIDRYRYHIRPVAVGGGGGSIEYVPYLMLDQGVDRNFDGRVTADDEVVVAEGVELLQLGYLFRQSNSTQLQSIGYSETGWPPSGMLIQFWQESPWWWGDSSVWNSIATTVMLPVPAGTVDIPYGPSSLHRYSPDSSQRLAINQGNIHAVRLALLTRSSVPDHAAPTNIRLDGTYLMSPMSMGSTWPLLNMTVAPPWITQNYKWNAGVLRGADGYRRALVHSKVVVPNMKVRGIAFF